MNGPHLRPAVRAQLIASASIPLTQAKALDRRRNLDAQQRAYRESVSRFDRAHVRPPRAV
jgi:hypothetical protein